MNWYGGCDGCDGCDGRWRYGGGSCSPCMLGEVMVDGVMDGVMEGVMEGVMDGVTDGVSCNRSVRL